MAEQEKPGFSGLISRAVAFFVRNPVAAICIWLIYRDIKRDISIEEKDKRIEKRDSIREAKYYESMNYSLDYLQNELKEKKAEVLKKYEKDTL